MGWAGVRLSSGGPIALAPAAIQMEKTMVQEFYFTLMNTPMPLFSLCNCKWRGGGENFLCKWVLRVAVTEYKTTVSSLFLPKRIDLLFESLQGRRWERNHPADKSRVLLVSSPEHGCFFGKICDCDTIGVYLGTLLQSTIHLYFAGAFITSNLTRTIIYCFNEPHCFHKHIVCGSVLESFYWTWWIYFPFVLNEANQQAGEKYLTRETGFHTAIFAQRLWHF